MRRAARADANQREVKLHFSGSLPSLNDVVTLTKRHWAKYAALKRSASNRICYQTLEARQKPIQWPVDVTFTWEQRTRRRDPDNVAHAAKYVLDGLVKARLLKDDGAKEINSIMHRFSYGHPIEGVVVELVPVKTVEAA